MSGEIMNMTKGVAYERAQMFPRDMYKHAHGAVFNDAQFRDVPEAKPGEECRTS